MSHHHSTCVLRKLKILCFTSSVITTIRFSTCGSRRHCSYSISSIEVFLPSIRLLAASTLSPFLSIELLRWCVGGGIGALVSVFASSLFGLLPPISYIFTTECRRETQIKLCRWRVWCCPCPVSILIASKWFWIDVHSSVRKRLVSRVLRVVLQSERADWLSGVTRQVYFVCADIAYPDTLPHRRALHIASARCSRLCLDASNLS